MSTHTTAVAEKMTEDARALISAIGDAMIARNVDPDLGASVIGLAVGSLVLTVAQSLGAPAQQLRDDIIRAMDEMIGGAK